MTLNSIIKGNQNTTKLINELKKDASKYEPLSKKQEEELIEKYKDNREKLNHELFMHNIRLVFNLAKKYMSKTEDFDAMIQDGMLGLATATERFDTSRKIKFITYATPWIKKKILERFYCKANEISKRSVSLDSPMGASAKLNDTDDANLENYVNDYIDTSVVNTKSIHQQLSSNEQSKLCADLYQEIDTGTDFNEKEKKVFKEMFIENEKSRDLQIKYDLTPKEISTIKRKILKHMRGRLESSYGIHSFSDVYDL